MSAPWALEDYERLERGLLAAVVLAAGLACALDLSSPVSADLRAGRPVRALVLAKKAGFSLAVQWEARERSLKALALPASTAVDASAGSTLGEVAAAAPPRAAASSVEALFKGKSGLFPVPHWLRWDFAGRDLAPEDFVLALAGGAARNWLGQPAAYLGLPALAWRLSRPGRSDLSAYDVLLLGLEVLRARSLAPAAPAGRTVKGRFVCAPDGLEALKTSFFAGAGPAASDAAPTAEVLNATGRAGFALSATKVLRWRGVDVVNFANAAESRRTSLVIDRTGRREEALKASRALGLTGPVLTMPDASRLAQATVIVGDDFKPPPGTEP